MNTLQHAGRTFHRATIVGLALGYTGPAAGAFAGILTSLPRHATLEDAGTLWLDASHINAPGLDGKLHALRHHDMSGNTRPLQRAFANPHQSVAIPVAGSVESARANARAFLRGESSAPKAQGGDYLDRAARKVATLRQSPGATLTSTPAAPALPASAPRQMVKPTGNSAAELQAAFGLPADKAAILAAAIIPSAAAPAAAQGSAGKVSESAYLARHASLARLTPSSPEHTAHKAELLEFARGRGIV